MRAITVACLLLLVGCSTRDQGLFPRHIEAPAYPPLARMARIPGRVVLLMTIEAYGNVIDAKTTTDDKSHPLLKSDAITNIRHWTFTKPSAASYAQIITYDYEIDESRPPDSTRTTVNFDLPDRVTIVTNVPEVNP